MSKSPAEQRPPLRKAPLQARSVETVRVIVEAAAHILEKVGLSGFTTNAVAERAGVSIGSLYQYFPGKESLIGALIVRETSVLIADWETALARPTGKEALSGLIVSAVAHQLRRPVLARLLDLEEARLPFDPETQNITRRLREILLDVLDRLDIRSEPHRNVTAQDVLAIIKGMVDAAGEQNERDQVDLSRRVSRAVYGYLNMAR